MHEKKEEATECVWDVGKRREPNVCEKKVEGTEHVRKKETTERQLNVCEKKGRKCEKRGRQQDN